jgi:hypothetical protein
MNLSGISQIRNHLYRINVGEEEIRNRPIRLSSSEYTTLPHAHIVVASETIKAVKNAVPSSEGITIGSEPVSLRQKHLAIGTIVCADDSSLSRVYQENLDYIIDYSAGTVTRTVNGAIPAEGKITIWYLYYHVYQRNIDYYIDYERGRLRRLSTGGIEEGQELLIDYRLGSSEFSDSEIEQCLVEAEAEIMHIIDPAFRESTDPALQTAATCLALSSLCRNSAGIAATGREGTGNNSMLWMDLARSYRETAMRLLTWFRPESPTLKPPRLARKEDNR